MDPAQNQGPVPCNEPLGDIAWSFRDVGSVLRELLRESRATIGKAKDPVKGVTGLAKAQLLERREASMNATRDQTIASGASA